MGKIGILMLFISITLSTFSQEHISIAKRFFSLFKPNIDTTYIANGPHNFSIKPYAKTEQGITSFLYSDTIENAQNYSFKITDIPTLLLGLELSYKGFSFGYDVNSKILSGKRKDKGYDFNCNYYGQNFGTDFFFSTKNQVEIKNDNDKKIYDKTIDCFSTSRFQASIYYILRNQIFSMPAAFTQSMIQKKSAGSIIFGINATNTLILLNTSKIPTGLDSILVANTMFKHFRQTALGISCGYGRNIVRNHFVFHFSVQPYLPIYMEKKIKLTNGEKLQSDMWDLNVGIKSRGAINWFYKHHAINFNTVIDANVANQVHLNATDAFVRFYLSYKYVF